MGGTFAYKQGRHWCAQKRACIQRWVCSSSDCKLGNAIIRCVYLLLNIRENFTLEES